ncbi:MAG: TIGR04376 family protein [Drouetiella hepatica Uher 2000/2452]|uniref:TIGR04376 family protein n=1 Tax=Drouetiella hepatica Uher 2000/2452 TaxID=904376 RepID=A0A951Q993_9CYAN|nr:TIGR04376 family protein [Drouetiella hepatica Uher 2000/2452]
MGLFEDFSTFLEMRLEEFLRSNPDLELMALEEKLREQEEETIRLLADLRLREKKIQDEILATAQEVQRWHVRIEKAKTAQRLDLLKPAEEREAALLRQGNQLWGQMEVVKGRIKQAAELHQQIQARKQEVKTKIVEAQAQAQAAKASASQAAASQATEQVEQKWQTSGWNQNYRFDGSSADPLEQKFKQWETEEELERLKRQMGR